MIALVDYGMGNLRSLKNALEYVGVDVGIVVEPAQLDEFSHAILPGVGAFGKAMRNLASIGFVPALQRHVAAGKPLLGICLGMQVFASGGEEFGEHEGLGFVPGRVTALESTPKFPVPHVGWNTIGLQREHPVFARAKRSVDYYFVHSYHFTATSESDVVAVTDYGRQLTAVVARGNVIGCQFHPEKSQAGGLALLEGFAEWDGRC